MISGVLAALITPFCEDGSIDWSCFERYVDWLCNQNLSGIVLCGSTGEGFSLTPWEYQEIIKKSVKIANKRVHVMAGASGMNLSDTLTLINLAHESGAESALVVSPPYSKPSQVGLIEYYQKIHDRTSLPLIIYNNPSRTGTLIEIDTLVHLCHQPRIIGLKDSSTDLSRPLLLKSLIKDKHWSVLSGDDATFLPFITSGGNGIISVAAGLIPELYVRLWQEVHNQNLKKAQDWGFLLAPLHQAMSLESNPGPIKYACQLVHHTPLTSRVPIGPLSEKCKKAIENCLLSLNLITHDTGKDL